MLKFDEVHGLLSFGFVLDEVAVLGQMADQWIDLVQAQRQLRMSLQVARTKPYSQEPTSSAAQASSTLAPP
jgi:hypothetical protein